MNAFARSGHPVATTSRRRLTGRLLVASLVLFASNAIATTYLHLTPVELLSRADVVFTGQVVDITTAVRDDGSPADVYTTVRFAVDEVYRGYGVGQGPDGEVDDDPLEPLDPLDPLDPDASEQPGNDDDQDLTEVPADIELEFLGGEAAGDLRLLVAGSPTWRTGDRVLVSAYLDRELASPLTGFNQGVWRLVDDGYVDLDGRALGLDASGRLARSDLPGSPAEVLAAVAAVVDGEVPPSEAADAPEPPPSQPEPLEPETGEPAEPLGPSESVEPSDDDSLEPISVSLRVDDEGGPLLLSEAVTAAASLWEALGGDSITIDLEATAANSVAYAPAALFSPEVISLTLVRGGPNGGLTTLLSPTSAELLPRALHHELGLLMGLPADGVGVMSMAITDQEAVPGEAELDSLAGLDRFAPADLSRDGSVDFRDLLEFAVAYGRAGLNLPADLDRDGDVDDDDLEILRESYELTPPVRPE